MKTCDNCGNAECKLRKAFYCIDSDTGSNSFAWWMEKGSIMEDNTLEENNKLKNKLGIKI